MTDRIDPETNYARRALSLFTSYGDALAVIDVDGGRHTYAEVHRRTLATAAALWGHGVREGDAIGVLARNPIESIYVQLGAHLLGCRTAWIAPNAPARMRHDFLRLADVSVFVYDANTLPELGAELVDHAAAQPETADVTVLCFGPGRGVDLSAATDVDALPFDPATVTTAPVSLFQTGGTTGVPKLVQHEHRFFSALHDLSAAYLASGAPSLSHLTVSGTWHVSSQTAVFMTLFTGGVLHLHDGLEMDAFLHAIAHEGVNSTLVPPAILYELLDDARAQATDFSGLVTLTVAGGAANPTRLAEAVQRFGPVIRIVYGMSECPFITALPNLIVDPDHPDRIASAGPAYPGIEVEVRDEDGKPLPTGETGEICIRGPLLMTAYWGMPEQTAETLADGWLRTGDVGKVDEDGYLYILDRVKDMIVTGVGSTNVYSRSVEDALVTHPSVRTAAVVGVPHPVMGEAVHAFVVTEPGAQATVDELRDHVTAELNALWAPYDVTVVESFPLTEYGKVDKKALRAMWAENHTVASGGLG